MKWFAQAPSNIALIKYMGKKDADKNIPANPSLSYTLQDLLSFVEIEKSPDKEDVWEPLDVPGVAGFELNDKAIARFLKHAKLLKDYFQYNGGIIVRSCNNFPLASGLASSASSFAALTQCACRSLAELTHQPEPTVEIMAQLSRQGSGSSCRSFFSPWALWDGETTHAMNFPYDNLIHHVIVISHAEKAVLSSEAARRVTTSPLFAGRPERAKQRLAQLTTYLQAPNWQGCYEVAWEEFMDMHELFKTAAEPFQYMNAEVSKILAEITAFWQQNQDGPIVTLDAGPNIHLLFRPEQKELANTLKRGFVIDRDVL